MKRAFNIKKYFSKFEAFVILSSILIPLSIKADGGYIPLTDVNVWAPGQRAVVAWNGTREILILSLDVYVSNDSKVLKIIPLPSDPIRIEGGDLKIFKELNNLVYQYGRYFTASAKTGASVVQYKLIGSHNITVIEANSTEDFINWAKEYLFINGIEYLISSPRVEEVITKYIDHGIYYFVFDLIDLTSVPQSIEPILYEFESEQLFYPLEISSLAQGPVNIVLYLLTENPLNEYDLPNWMNYGHYRIGNLGTYETTTIATITYHTVVTYPLFRAIQLELGREELENLFSNTNEATHRTIQIFEDGAWLTVLSFQGILENLNEDLKLQSLNAWSTVTTVRTRTSTEYYFSFTSIPTVLRYIFTGTVSEEFFNLVYVTTRAGYDQTEIMTVGELVKISLPQTVSKMTQITIHKWMMTNNIFEYVPETLMLSNTTISELTLYIPWEYEIPIATTSTEIHTSIYGEVLAIPEFYHSLSIIMAALLMTSWIIYHRKKTGFNT